MNNKNYIYLVLIILFNIYFINTLEIYVDPDIGSSYIDNCGSLETPCKSLYDAGKIALTVKDGSLSVITVNDSSINMLPSGDTLGNLYPLCGVTVQPSYNQINIDGLEAKSTFFSFVEIENTSEYASCQTNKSVFRFSKINFNNWSQTIFNSKLQQESFIDSVEQFLQVQLQTVNFINSSSAVYHEPSNSLNRYNSSKVSYLFTRITFQNMDSVSEISPVHIVGGRLQTSVITRIMNIQNCKTKSSPFFYLKNAIIDQILLNINQSSILDFPIMFIENPNSIANGLAINTDNSEISSVFKYYISDKSIQYSSLPGFEFISNNNSYTYESRTPYSNSIFSFENVDDYLITISIPTFKSSLDSFSTKANMKDKISFFSLNNVSLEVQNFIYSPDPLADIEVLGRINYSDIKLFSSSSIANVLYPFIGEKSTILLTEESKLANKTLCLCEDCIYYEGTTKLSNINSSFCYNSDDIENTRAPENDDSKKKNNIIIIFVVLGVAAFSSIIIFSVVYKRHREKKYLLNSSTNISGSSSDLGEQTAASIDNDVSPNLESVLYDEDEDYAGLEKL